MDDVEPGAWALRLATTLVQVLVERDPAIAGDMQRVLAANLEGAPTPADRHAIEQSLVLVQLARERAEPDEY